MLKVKQRHTQIPFPYILFALHVLMSFNFCSIFSMLPISHCELVLIHVTPVGDETKITERQSREVRKVLSLRLSDVNTGYSLITIKTKHWLAKTLSKLRPHKTYYSHPNLLKNWGGWADFIFYFFLWKIST